MFRGFFLVRERASARRVVSRRSSSFVVVVLRRGARDVSFARRSRGGRARAGLAKAVRGSRRVQSPDSTRNSPKSSLMARIGRRVGEPKTFGSRARVRGRRKRARCARPPRHPHASGRSGYRARVCGRLGSRSWTRCGARVGNPDSRARARIASRGKNLRASRPGGHAPGSSSCHLLRASPPRRWRSRRGPSSDPSRRFGGSSASGACAAPAVV